MFIVCVLLEMVGAIMEIIKYTYRKGGYLMNMLCFTYTFGLAHGLHFLVIFLLVACVICLSNLHTGQIALTL